MHPRVNQFPQSISLTTKKRSNGVGKAPHKPGVLKSVLVKIVTAILFWQSAFGQAIDVIEIFFVCVALFY